MAAYSVLLQNEWILKVKSSRSEVLRSKVFGLSIKVTVRSFIAIKDVSGATAKKLSNTVDSR